MKIIQNIISAYSLICARKVIVPIKIQSSRKWPDIQYLLNTLCFLRTRSRTWKNSWTCLRRRRVWACSVRRRHATRSTTTPWWTSASRNTSTLTTRRNPSSTKSILLGIFIILISQCNLNSISWFFSMLIFFSALGKFFLVIYQFFFSERIFWMVEIVK